MLHKGHKSFIIYVWKEVFKIEIKDIIRKKREELGLTYEQLGDMVGVGKSTVRKWEMGMIENMRRDSIAALAKALNITPSVIMGWEKFEEPEPIEKIMSHYNKLNDIGKHEATKRVEELTYINMYTDVKPNYLMPIAAHADDLTDSEKEEMNRRIIEIIEKRKMK